MYTSLPKGIYSSEIKNKRKMNKDKVVKWGQCLYPVGKNSFLKGLFNHNNKNVEWLNIFSIDSNEINKDLIEPSTWIDRLFKRNLSPQG